jgi:hypothetical protein
MTEKSSLYATAIQRISVWKGESGIAYNSCYFTSLEYGTPATTLTQQECYNIQNPVFNAILPKMGISRESHRSVVFGTDQYGGSGLENIADCQGHIRLQYLMGHLTCNSNTGKLMRSMLDYTQLECGCTGTRLRKVFKCYHDRKLDHCNVGTFALVQLKFEDHCEMETAKKPPERRHRDGSTDRDWRLFGQRSQRYQPLQDIPSDLLHLLYIHTQCTSNHILGMEGKTIWRKDVVLGMSSSTMANLVESMETDTRILSIRWLCCTVIR